MIPGAHMRCKPEPDAKECQVFSEEDEIEQEESVARPAIFDIDIAENGDESTDHVEERLPDIVFTKRQSLALKPRKHEQPVDANWN